MSEIDSVWNLLQFGKSVNPDEVIHQVRMNTLTLVQEHLLLEKPTVLIRVGRKGAHLFGPYDARIEEKGFITCTYRLIAKNRFATMKPSLDLSKTAVILITDTIHKGEEMKNVLVRLQAEKIKVHKIFCYSKYQKGVDNLVQSGLIKEDQIISLFSSITEEEYMEKCKQLLAFFRSRIEPMDPDLCYDTYNVDDVIDLKNFAKIIVPILEEIFGKKLTIFEASDNGFASNVQELSCYVENSEIESKITNTLFKKTINCKIPAISIRFKLNQKNVDTDFTAIIKTGSSCNIGNNKAIECLNHSNHCCMELTDIVGLNQDEAKQLICPTCIEIHISDYILNEIKSRITKKFFEIGLTCKLKWPTRPYGFED